MKIIKHASAITTRHVQTTLHLASEIWPMMPSKGDGIFRSAMKLLSIANTVRNHTQGNDALRNFFRKMEVQEVKRHNSALFIDLFFKTPIFNDFTVTRHQVTVEMAAIQAQSSHGTLYFIEYQGLTNVSISDNYYSSEGFNFNDLLESLWQHYDSRLYIAVKYNPLMGRLGAEYHRLLLNHDPMSQLMEDTLAKRVERHEVYTSKGYQRTYLFVGVPGVGKTTLALRFARSCGKRVLRIDSSGLATGGVDDMNLFLGGLKPDFLLIEDVDRVTDKENMSTILDTLTYLKEVYPNTTIVMTANNIDVMDAAMTRPGRIDKVLQFDPPDAEERRRILDTYFTEYGIKQEVPQELVDNSEGLTAAYLKDVAIQYDCDEALDDILNSLKTMRELASGDEESPKVDRYPETPATKKW